MRGPVPAPQLARNLLFFNGFADPPRLDLEAPDWV
jgi:hypothetical protein